MLKVAFFLILLFAVIYLAVRLATGVRATPTDTPRRRGPIGPDDDEDFLRELRRRRKPRDPES